MAFTDFFKPHWKHSNPAVRAASIRSLEEDQQPLLASIALLDAEPANRLIAARKVKHPDLLKKLKEQSADKNIQDLANKEWLQLQIAIAKSDLKTNPADAKETITLSQCRAALESLGENQKALEDVVKNSPLLEIRKLAFQKLTHATTIQTVAQNELDEALALQALAKISRDSQLESLAKNARSKAVRTAAKEKIKSLRLANGPDEISISRAKMNLVLGVGEKIRIALEAPTYHFDWEAHKNQLDEAENALSKLQAEGVEADSKKLEIFREAASIFRSQFAKWNHDRSEKEIKEKQGKENAAQKLEICEALEALVNSGFALEEIDAEGQLIEGSRALEIKALREKFKGLGSSESATSAGLDADFNKRFRMSMETLERRGRQTLDQVKRHADEKDIVDRLTSLCEQAISLSQLPILQALERFRDLRKEWAKALQNSRPFAGREELVAKFENAIASTHSGLEGLKENNLKRMQEILPQLEALLEVPNMLEAEKSFKVLNSEWKSLFPTPTGAEAEELQARHIAFVDRFREAQDWLRWSNLRSKQNICDRLEALAKQEERKAMVAHLKDLQAEWKELGPVPWDSSEALWDRYNTVVDALYEKCREYFAELEVERESNLKVKEEICARIEGLNAAEEIDWREAMEIVKEAQGSWKSLGAVPKTQNEIIWNRFRSACTAFFEKKDSHNQDNLSKKMQLVELTESLQDSTEWKVSGIQIKEAQEKWKTIGPVPRDQSEVIWQRFHSACEKFFTARRGYMEKMELERPQNQAKKEALCLEVETLESIADDVEKFEKIKVAQAAWKEIGPATREVDEVLWERFRKPIDAYFEIRKVKMGEERLQREENAKVKEDICLEAESVIGSTEWKATIEKIKTLQERWKATGPAPRELDRELWRRFRAACDGFFERLKENSASRDQERAQNLIRKIDLCFIAEMMSSATPTDEQVKERAIWMEKKLPVDIERFRQPGIDWNDNTEKIKALQRQWKNIGPVPREMNEPIWDRFHAACDIFFEERRVALGLPAEDPQVSLEKKLELLTELENLAQNPEEGSKQRLQSLQREWKRIGQVPKAQSDYVWKRYTDACDAILNSKGNIQA